MLAVWGHNTNRNKNKNKNKNKKEPRNKQTNKQTAEVQGEDLASPGCPREDRVRRDVCGNG